MQDDDITKRWCAGCGNPIPEGRLKIVPNAVKCVPCIEGAGDGEKSNIVGYMVYSEDFHGDPSSGTLHITTEDNLDKAGDEKFSRRRRKP
jgi:hypothetical protein